MLLTWERNNLSNLYCAEPARDAALQLLCNSCVAEPLRDGAVQEGCENYASGHRQKIERVAPFVKVIPPNGLASYCASHRAKTGTGTLALESGAEH